MRTKLICMIVALFLVMGGRRPAPANPPETPNGPEAKGELGRTFATPDAAFAAFKAALVNKDEDAFLQCYTDYSLKALVVAMIHGGVRQKEFGGPEKSKKIDALFDAHGLAALKKMRVTEIDTKTLYADPRKLDAFIKPVQDRRAFSRSMMKVVGIRPLLEPTLANASVKDIVISGDRATGQLVTVVDGKEKVGPFFFKKENGGWKIIFPPIPGLK